MKNKFKVNHLLFMDDQKIYAKNRMELESSMNTISVLKQGNIEMGTDDMIMPGGGEIKAMAEDSD